MKIAPYILYSEAMLGKFHARLQDCLRIWAEKWELQEDFSITDIASIMEVKEELIDGPALFLNIAENGNQWALLCPAGTALPQLGAMLLHDGRHGARFAGTNQGEIPGELAECCLSELAKEILRRQDLESPEPERLLPPFNKHPVHKELWQGSGIVRFQISSGDDFAVDVYVSPSVVNPVEPSGEDDTGGLPLQSCKEALGPEKVRAKVLLCDIELTLDALGSVSVGDVILLDQSVDEPCLIEFENSELRCRGFLGKKKEMLAVKVDSLGE